jgi:transcriptional regulator GlxA family with amidase domain
MLHYIEDWEGVILTTEGKKHTILQAIMMILPDAGNRKLPIALPVPKDERLQKVVNFMQDQMTENINIGKISVQFGFSERSLLRLFQDDIKMSYAQYLKTLRAIRAIELLTTTNLAINEVAFQVGYDSFPTFSNTFLEIVGVRPKVYRR